VSFFKALRVSILLLVLLIVVAGQCTTRSRLSSWGKPVWMTIYPILTSSDDKIRPYVDSLTTRSFQEIGDFLTQQGKRYGRALNTPLKLQIASPTYELPPAVPPRGARFDIAIWSLKMRWWAWRRDREDNLPRADVQMFVLYHDGFDAQLQERSVGLQKGMFGIVNAYASRGWGPRNRIVIAHELLHLFGATDKYAPGTGQPYEPAGLAEPERRPVYPQRKAEIMAGRIALSPAEVAMPATLGSCLIGHETAIEIGWQ
jgi:hypothetical protein